MTKDPTFFSGLFSNAILHLDSAEELQPPFTPSKRQRGKERRRERDRERQKERKGARGKGNENHEQF